MKIYRAVIFLTLLAGVLATVSNINLNPTGYYAKISTKGGLYVSITLLIFVIFGELGYLPFLRFVGRRKRSAVSNLLGGGVPGDRNAVLQMIRSIDHRDCLLRYLCELEALRLDAEKNGTGLDPAIEDDLFLLKVAKRNMHPAELMRQDPGSPALAFEVAVFTGSEGLESCANVFNSCPYNVTTMQTFLANESLTNLL